MTTKRFFYIMTSLVVLLCLAILGVAFAGNKLLKQQAGELSDIRAQNQVVEDQKVALARAREDIEKYSDLNELAKAIVPHDKDQARAVRELNVIAAESGIQLQQVSFEASTLGEAVSPNGNQSQSKTDGQPESNEGAGSQITQAVPVDGIPGVYSIPITIVPTDDVVLYEQFLKFLERLEKNRRTAHITSIDITPIDGGDFITFSFTMNLYVKP